MFVSNNCLKFTGIIPQQSVSKTETPKLSFKGALTPDTVSFSGSSNKKGKTPLDFAKEIGASPEIIELLEEASKKGKTIRDFAKEISAGPGIIELLEEASKKGKTIRDFAKEIDANPEIIKLLLKDTPDVNSKT